MKENDRQDTLDSLLDSINMDDTMEKKIDDFARNKERLKRIERARQNSRQFQEAYGSSSENQNSQETGQNEQTGTTPPSYPEQEEEQDQQEPLGNTIAPQNRSAYYQQPGYAQTGLNDSDGLEPGQETGEDQPAEDQIGNTITAGLGGTRVFDRQNSVSPEEAAGGTRNMTPEEIQELLDEDDRPILRREYISDHEEEMEERPVRTTTRKKKKGVSWKLPVAIVGIAMLALIAIGIFTFGGFGQSSQPSDTQTRNFERLKNWAEKYDSYTDDEKEQITSFSNVYNKLTDDQKREINKILEGITGSTFDQLLAAADSDQKTDPSENYTGKAEKKRALQAELTALENQLAESQRNLDQANSDYRSNQSKMDAMQSSYDQAQANLSDWTDKVKNLQDVISENKAVMDSQGAEVTRLQRELDEARNAEDPDEDQISSLTSQLNDAQSAYDAAKKKYDDANLDLPGYQNNKQKAQSTYDDLKNEYDGYKSKRDEAGTLSDQLSSEVSGLQSSIDTKKSEIDALK